MIGSPERAWLAVFAGMPRTGTTSSMSRRSVLVSGGQSSSMPTR